MKQAILIRTDLKMSKGKIAAQAAHASIASFLKAKAVDREKWIRTGMKKIVLKVPDQATLLLFAKQAKKAKLPYEIIKDAGLTQLEPGTATALGIGPAECDKIDRLTAKLKLL